MDLVHYVVRDGVIPELAAAANSESRRSNNPMGVGSCRQGRSNSTAAWRLEELDQCLTVHNALKKFEDLVEMTRMTLVGPGDRDRLTGALNAVVERTQDFTDSAYTSHEHRENILLLCDRARLELNQLLRIGIGLVSLPLPTRTRLQTISLFARNWPFFPLICFPLFGILTSCRIRLALCRRTKTWSLPSYKRYEPVRT